MKRFLTQVAVFTVLVATILLLLLLAMDTELIVGRKKLYMQKHIDKHYDLLVLGSSRAQNTFNPLKYAGPLRLFNMGEEGHGMPSNYLMLKVLIEKYHVDVKTLLLQVDEFSFDGTTGFSRKFRDDYFVNDISDPEVYEAFRRYRGSVHAGIMRRFPFMANLVYTGFTNFIKYEALSLKRFVPAFKKIYLYHIEESARLGGYKAYSPVPADKIRFFRERLILEEDDVQYFQKLVKLCQRHGINLYLYRSPVLRCDLSSSKPFDDYINRFASKNHIKFFDYKCMYQWPDQYRNQNHSADSISAVLTNDILHKMEFQ